MDPGGEAVMTRRLLRAGPPSLSGQLSREDCLLLGLRVHISSMRAVNSKVFPRPRWTKPPGEGRRLGHLSVPLTTFPARPSPFAHTFQHRGLWEPQERRKRSKVLFWVTGGAEGSKKEKGTSSQSHGLGTRFHSIEGHVHRSRVKGGN